MYKVEPWRIFPRMLFWLLLLFYFILVEFLHLQICMIVKASSLDLHSKLNRSLSPRKKSRTKPSRLQVNWATLVDDNGQEEKNVAQCLRHVGWNFKGVGVHEENSMMLQRRWHPIQPYKKDNRYKAIESPYFPIVGPQDGLSCQIICKNNSHSVTRRCIINVSIDALPSTLAPAFYVCS